LWKIGAKDAILAQGQSDQRENRQAWRSDMQDEYILTAKEEIKKWESEGPGFLAKAGNMALWPAQKAAEALIPEGVQKAINRAVLKFLTGLGSATRLIINESEGRAKAKSLQAVYGYGLRASDEAAKHYRKYHVAYAAAEGAATGATGIFGLVTDIPSLFTISLRAIQQVGICYGYDMKKETEREYMMHILRTGSTSDVRAKLQFMIGLKQVEEVLKRVSLNKASEALASKEIGRYSLLATVGKFAESLGLQITKRKSLQLVPVVGAVVGGVFNSVFVSDIGEAAYMNYRRRRIEEDEGMDAASLML